MKKGQTMFFGNALALRRQFDGRLQTLLQTLLQTRLPTSRYAVWLGLLPLLMSCSTLQPPADDAVTLLRFEPLAAVTSIPQDPSFLSAPIELSAAQQEALELEQAQYASHVFAIWRPHVWGKFKDFVAGIGSQVRYGENLLPRPAPWVQQQIVNSQFDEYGSLNLAAIVVEDADERSFPTYEAGYYHNASSEQSYPFDSYQQTRLSVGTPVRISHYSRDRAWAFVETSHSDAGWVEVKKLATTTPSDQSVLTTGPLVIAALDGVPVYDEHGHFAFYSRLGSPLPSLGKTEHGFRIRIPRRAETGQLYFSEGTLPLPAGLERPLSFTAPQVRYAVQQFMGDPYGWGNHHGHRDCSSMTKDFYSLFGIFLPRNSSAQARAFKAFATTGSSIDEKITAVRRQATPFLSLVWRPGHIGIYAGTYKGQAVLFHSAWGVRFSSDQGRGRHIIGKAVLSRLDFGKEVVGVNPANIFAQELVSTHALLQRNLPVQAALAPRRSTTP